MPGYSSFHPVDEILSSLALSAVPSDNQLIADQVLEPINIPERSFTLLIENTRNFMGDASKGALRAPGTPREQIASFARTNTTGKANIYGLEDSIPMEDIRDSQFPGSEEERLARKVGRALKIKKEKRVGDLLFSAGTGWNTTNIGVVSTAWNVAGGEPLTDLQEAYDRAFAGAHGIPPDTLVIGYNAFRAICRNPEVRSYVGSSAAGIAAGNQILTHEAALQVLRDVVGVPNVFFAPARYESAVPGAASSESFIWNNESAWIGILRGSDAIVSATGAVKLMPLAMADFQFEPTKAGQYDSLDLVNRFVWAEESCTEKVLDTNFGELLTNTL